MEKDIKQIIENCKIETWDECQKCEHNSDCLEYAEAIAKVMQVRFETGGIVLRSTP